MSRKEEIILAGDVGGTKSRLGVFRVTDKVTEVLDEERFENRERVSFYDIVREFLQKHMHSIDKCCIGVAGPVTDGQVKTTNLPWHITEIELAATIGTNNVTLVNDLVAFASAVPVLSGEDLTALYNGSGETTSGLQVRCVVAPGTGLGQASVVTKLGHHEILPSEGGHAQFAPRDEQQISFLEFLRAKNHITSVEHVLCGKGIALLYTFIIESKIEVEDAKVAARFSDEDPSFVISQCALSASDAACVRTLTIYVELLAGHCQNMMLTYFSSGGVYLGGGIPPKILPLLVKDNRFVEVYLDNPVMGHLLRKTPVYLINDDKAALRGAVRIAMEG